MKFESVSFSFVFWSLKGGKLVSRRFCRGALEGSIRDWTSGPCFPFRTLLKVSRSSNWNRRDSGRMLLWIRRSLYVSYEVIQRVTLLWKLSNFSKLVLFANQIVVPYKIKNDGAAKQVGLYCRRKAGGPARLRSGERGPTGIAARSTSHSLRYAEFRSDWVRWLIEAR